MSIVYIFCSVTETGELVKKILKTIEYLVHFDFVTKFGDVSW